METSDQTEGSESHPYVPFMLAPNKLKTNRRLIPGGNKGKVTYEEKFPSKGKKVANTRQSKIEDTPSPSTSCLKSIHWPKRIRFILKPLLTL